MQSVERIGQYQIVRRMESDITGAVCLVLDPTRVREVVVKMVQLDWFAAPEAIAGFRLALHRDLRSAARLCHPAIPSVFDVFEELGLTWIVIEYVSGKSLAQLLSGEQPLDRDTFRRIIRQAAAALDYAHGQGHVHENVKPSKILVQENGSPRILGFGQARISTSRGLKRGGEPIGPPYYLSPEQIRETAADGRADQFSLAVIVYQILAGALPFSGDWAAAGQQIMETGPVSAERRNPSLGPEAGRVLLRALAKTPGERYESCAAFVDALEAGLEQSPEWRVPRQGEETEPVEVVEASAPRPAPEPEQRVSELELDQPLLEPELQQPESKLELKQPSPEPRHPEPVIEPKQPESKLELKQPLPGPELKQLIPEAEQLQPEPGPEPTQPPLEPEPEQPPPEPVLQQPPPEPVHQQPPPEPVQVEAVVLSATGEDSSPPELIPVTEKRRRLAVPLLAAAVILAVAGLYVWSPLRPDSEPRSASSSKLSNAPGDLPNGTAGTPYSHALPVSGENPPHQWSLAEGELPPGVTLNAASGTIQGTPAAAGAYSFRVQVTDASQATATRSYTLMVGSGLGIAGDSSLPRGVLETAYSHQMLAAGASPPARWSVSEGSLPRGLALDSSTGAIHGTPTQAGEFQFTLEVTDASGARARKEFALWVESGLTIVTTSELPRGLVGRDYSQNLAARAGSPPYRWTLTGGSLPPGLSLGSFSGIIRGVPAIDGTSRFTIRVTDAAEAAATREFILSVGSGLTITTAPVLPRAIAGASYSYSLTAGGGNPPYRWSIAEGRLPTGLSLDAAGGMIRGTPRQAGENRLTARVTDSSGIARDLSLMLLVGPALTITTAPALPKGVVGSAYFHKLAAAGGNGSYLWSLVKGSLPAGISLDASAGALRGVPGRAGTAEFTLQVTDASRAKATRSFSLNVGPPLTISPAPAPPPGSTGKPYLHRLAAEGGNAPYRWALTGGSLPGGLTLDSSGAIQGTPASAGTHRFTVRVSDASQAAATQSLTLAIAPGPAIATAAALPDAEALAGYSQTLEVASGTPPFRWSLVEGSLPPGLTLDPRGGISGTPTSQGEFAFTALVTDSTQAASRQAFRLRVLPALQMAAQAALPEGKVGEAFSQKLEARGGKPPYTWSLPENGIAPGLSLNSSTGLIEGRPARAGDYRFHVEVASSSGARMSQLYKLVIKPSLSGRIVWRGKLESNRVLTIQDAKYASAGQLIGELPGVPVQIELQPPGVAIVEAPGPQNDWKLLVIHSGVEPRDEIVIQWTRIE